MTAALGEPVDPKLAMRGDIALVEGPAKSSFWALGVVRGEWVECLERMVPIARAQCAWRITPRERR